MGCASSADAGASNPASSPKSRTNAGGSLGGGSLGRKADFDEVTIVTNSMQVSTFADSTMDSTTRSVFSQEVMDLDSSWDFDNTQIAVPDGMVVRAQPTKKSHSKHVKKLNRFLQDVKNHPEILLDAVERKRVPLSENALSDAPTVRAQI
mmetsp:Transcript_58513/g.130720  ORF Transcript_58513/g.130720 Transcript_58513/m.130720 type:complete len:150 (+) Transcript_58513:88-537(+)